MNVELEPVRYEDKPVLRRMMELYQYDFSEMEGSDLDAHGRFGYRYLDHYWTEEGRLAFFVRVDGRLAGFALVRRMANALDVDYSLAEFFVMRKYRRHGVGRAAAEGVWRRFGGVWELSVLAANPGARAFWERVVAHFSGGRYDVRRWDEADGVVLRFDAGPAEADGG